MVYLNLSSTLDFFGRVLFHFDLIHASISSMSGRRRSSSSSSSSFSSDRSRASAQALHSSWARLPSIEHQPTPPPPRGARFPSEDRQPSWSRRIPSPRDQDRLSATQRGSRGHSPHDRRPVPGDSSFPVPFEGRGRFTHSGSGCPSLSCKDG